MKYGKYVKGIGVKIVGIAIQFDNMRGIHDSDTDGNCKG